MALAPEQDQPEGIVTLRLEGVAEHHGHILAHALAQKLREFLAVFASYERAHVGSRTRQTDFEVVALSHNSPTELRLHPIPRVMHYLPIPTAHWTFEQWEKIARGEKPAETVGEDLITDVATLARRPTALDYANFSIRFGRRRIVFDDRTMVNVEAVRRASRPSSAPPWQAGYSIGAVRGELRSVIDERGEREIVVVPPIGPERIRCVFEGDRLKDKIRDNLWHYVQASGRLQYTANSPHPVLVMLEDLEALDLDEERGHFLEARGLFSDSHYPPRPGDLM